MADEVSDYDKLARLLETGDIDAAADRLVGMPRWDILLFTHQFIHNSSTADSSLRIGMLSQALHQREVPATAVSP